MGRAMKPDPHRDAESVIHALDDIGRDGGLDWHDNTRDLTALIDALERLCCAPARSRHPIADGLLHVLHDWHTEFLPGRGKP